LKESNRRTLLVVTGRIVVSTTAATATAATPSAVNHGGVIRSVTAAKTTAIVARRIVLAVTATSAIVARLWMPSASAEKSRSELVQQASVGCRGRERQGCKRTKCDRPFPDVWFVHKCS
jgi:hypothetical protein